MLKIALFVVALQIPHASADEGGRCFNMLHETGLKNVINFNGPNVNLQNPVNASAKSFVSYSRVTAADLENFKIQFRNSPNNPFKRKDISEAIVKVNKDGSLKGFSITKINSPVVLTSCEFTPFKKKQNNNVNDAPTVSNAPKGQ